MRGSCVAAILLIFAPVNAIEAQDNPSEARKSQLSSDDPVHPTRDPGIRKLSTRERKARLALLDGPSQEFLAAAEPIMLPGDSDSFLILETNAERDDFIERFWQVRDPDPDTERNEYKEQYFDLRNEARARFQNLTSDRARVFLARGRPAEVSSVEACDQYLVPIEVWRYDELPAVRGGGHIVFYQPRDGIDFRLWNPNSSRTIEELEDLLSEQGENEGAERIFNTMLAGTEASRIVWECENGDKLLEAVTWVRQHRLENASMFAPPSTEIEETRELINPAVKANPEAPKLVAGFSAEYPGKRGSRTSTQMTLMIDASQLGVRDLSGSTYYNLDVIGEILHEDRMRDSFRYRYDLRVDSTGEQIPLVLERFLRPDKYSARIKIVDINSGGEAVVLGEIDVPYIDVESAMTSEELEANEATGTLQHDYRKGASEVRIVPLGEAIRTGLQRIDTLVTGKDIAGVEFYLDGKKIMTKRRPPYTLDLDLGDIPMTRRIKVVGLDAHGKVITGDEAVLNLGSDPFRVRIVSPRVVGDVSGEVRVATEVKVPQGRQILNLELYLNESRIATLFDRPFVQTIHIPKTDEFVYLRAVATLDDERRSKAEDIVYLSRTEYTFDLDVHLVELPTTVHLNGRPADSLRPEEFTILDDGTAVEIAKFEYVKDLPLSIGIAIDSSGSMKHRMYDAQKAGAEFFFKVLRPGDKGFVVAFDTLPRVVQTWTNRLTDLNAGLASLRAEESTALYDAVVYSLYNFQGIKGQKALVLISDGEDTASKFTFDQALEYARRSALPIYTIGIGIKASASDIRYKLGKLASETGGESFYITRAIEIGRIYDKIEEQLRSQYLLGFYPPSGVEPGSDWREVRVKVRNGDARTIRGYYP